MPLILGANSITGGYEVDNSLRFDDGSSDYLSKTVHQVESEKHLLYQLGKIGKFRKHKYFIWNIADGSYSI
jgi:hypothetical protein